MTKLSTDWAGMHGAGLLGVSRSDSSAEWAYIFGALRAYVFQGLTLEALYGDRGRWLGGVGNDDGVGVASRLHNHLQSSGEHNMSRAHSRSTLLANPSPALLSRRSIATISFPWGKGRCGP